VDFTASIRNILSKLSFETLTERKEVFTSLRRYIKEQFKDNRLSDTVGLDGHLGVLARLRIVNGISVDILCKLHVNGGEIGILVLVVVEGPLLKAISVSDVVAVVNEDECALARMLVESASEFYCCAVEELMPLGFEELVGLNLDSVRALNSFGNRE
jgi:hypothetical protein